MCVLFDFLWQGSQIVPRTPLALIPLGEKDKEDVLLRFVQQLADISVCNISLSSLEV